MILKKLKRILFGKPKKYKGPKIMDYPNPLAKKWHGQTAHVYDSLPRYWNNRKVKVWVILSDDDDPLCGPIFYKKKRKNHRKTKKQKN